VYIVGLSASLFSPRISALSPCDHLSAPSGSAVAGIHGKRERATVICA